MKVFKIVGEIYLPTLYPDSFRTVDTYASTEPFPLVPAICTKDNWSCGFPSKLNRFRIGSTLNSPEYWLQSARYVFASSYVMSVTLSSVYYQIIQNLIRKSPNHYQYSIICHIFQILRTWWNEIFYYVDSLDGPLKSSGPAFILCSKETDSS